MGGRVDKLWSPLGGKPVLARVIDVFQQCESIGQIVVVVSQRNIGKTEQLVATEKWSKVTGICAGGVRRQDSIAAGLRQLGECDWVVIHDGARPLVTIDLIEKGLEAAKKTGAAIAAVPVIDTVKVASDEGFVERTLARAYLWTVQTPQVFSFDIISDAFQEAKGEATDDASLVEQAGYKVKLYMGSYDNIKITTPSDLALARVLWEQHGG